MRKRLSILTRTMAILAGIFILYSFAAEPARADCFVTDPTGTPLNVRSYPNGPVVNRLRNGRRITVLQWGRDRKGRTWARVGGNYKGAWREWGWVFKPYISCYQ